MSGVEVDTQHRCIAGMSIRRLTGRESRADGTGPQGRQWHMGRCPTIPPRRSNARPHSVCVSLNGD